MAELEYSNDWVSVYLWDFEDDPVGAEAGEGIGDHGLNDNWRNLADAIQAIREEEKYGLQFALDNGNVALTVGFTAQLVVPYNMDLVSWIALADVSGSISVDIWKDSYANYPPDVSDTIVGANYITISSALKNTDNTLTSWTKSLNAGDILKFYVRSCTDIKKLNIIFKVKGREATV